MRRFDMQVGFGRDKSGNWIGGVPQLYGVKERH